MILKGVVTSAGEGSEGALMLLVMLRDFRM
jgi:hypothetical protein